MRRRSVVVMALLALALAVAAPAYAQTGKEKPAQAQPKEQGKSKDAPDKGAPEKGAPAKDGGAALRGKAFAGTVAAVAGAAWTVRTAGHGDLTVDVSGARVKAPHGKGAAAADVKVGDRVAVKLENRPEGSAPLRARQVHLIPGRTFVHATGDVTAVAPGSVTLTSGQGETKTFALGADTAVRSGGETRAVGDVKVGDRVTVVARAADGTAAAIALHGKGA